MSRKMVFPTLLCLTPFLFTAPLSAQGAWSKAPPLPRACYSGQDTFSADAEKARTELEAAIERQEQINKALHDQVFALDPATLQPRLMAAAQKDPARSQEIMQAMASMGTAQGQGGAPAVDAAGGDFDGKRRTLTEDYQADRKAVLGPISIALEDPAQKVATMREYNRRYETGLCPRWFGKQIPDLVASYRAYLVEQVPKRAEAEAKAARMYELLGIPTKDFRPIAESRAVLDYVRFASELFGLRDTEPYKP